jgi:phage protein U
MNSTLYQFGLVQFTVYPLNVSDVTHITQTDWARKEIAGSAIFREWVGEGDEEISLKGKVFPHFFSMQMANGAMSGGNGMGHLDLLDEMRRYGQAHLLMRGDGIKLGWFVIEKLSRGHTHLGGQGVGQQVDFDATFQRVPVPDASFYYGDTTSFVGGN